jgi:hypothetical protein
MSGKYEKKIIKIIKRWVYDEDDDNDDSICIIFVIL